MSEVFPGSPPPMDSFKNVCELLRKAWPEDRSLEGERYGYHSHGDLRER